MKFITAVMNLRTAEEKIGTALLSEQTWVTNFLSATDRPLTEVTKFNHPVITTSLALGEPATSEGPRF